MKMIVEKYMECRLIGRGNKPKFSRRKPTPAPPLLSITKSHMTRPGFEPGPPLWGKPATNRLSYGTASFGQWIGLSRKPFEIRDTCIFIFFLCLEWPILWPPRILTFPAGGIFHWRRILLVSQTQLGIVLYALTRRGKGGGREGTADHIQVHPYC
jgi:hypothetical protein